MRALLLLLLQFKIKLGAGGGGGVILFHSVCTLKSDPRLEEGPIGYATELA